MNIALVKEAIFSKDFDYAYLLQLEQAKLKSMYNYFNSYRYTSDWKRIRSQIKICIDLLDILINEDYTKKVNVRNIDRFTKNLDKKDNSEGLKNFIITHPNELAYLKANNLYYEIRKQYTKTWWD